MSFINYKGTKFAPWLLPIIPIDATLSEHSKLTRAHLGKIPGLKNDDGTWTGFADWTKAKISDGVLPRWDAWYVPPQTPTIGIAGRLLPCVDIDCDKEMYAQIAQDVAERMLGATISRTRANSPRRLLMYRLDQKASDFIRKARYTFKDQDDDEFTIEVLGLGQQYLIEGMHKSGVPYEWVDGKTPLLAGFESLPLVTFEKMHLFGRELTAALGLWGCTPVRASASRSGSGVEGKRIAITPDHPLAAPSMEKLIEALGYINVNDSQLVVATNGRRSHAPSRPRQAVVRSSTTSTTCPGKKETLTMLQHKTTISECSGKATLTVELAGTTSQMSRVAVDIQDTSTLSPSSIQRRAVLLMKARDAIQEEMEALKPALRAIWARNRARFLPKTPS